MKRRDIEDYIIDINKKLKKLHFKLTHKYNYTIELFLLNETQELVPVFIFKTIIFEGTKKECYNFLHSFMNIVSLTKMEGVI